LVKLASGELFALEQRGLAILLLTDQTFELSNQVVELIRASLSALQLGAHLLQRDTIRFDRRLFRY